MRNSNIEIRNKSKIQNMNVSNGIFVFDNWTFEGFRISIFELRIFPLYSGQNLRSIEKKENTG